MKEHEEDLYRMQSHQPPTSIIPSKIFRESHTFLVVIITIDQGCIHSYRSSLSHGLRLMSILERNRIGKCMERQEIVWIIRPMRHTQLSTHVLDLKMQRKYSHSQASHKTEHVSAFSFPST